ncbi:hypothetical protein ACH4F6_24035 [Streptomyces sp. NPDC017936]|uniref:hypothetical protein n=1 Tax=Streptomyces sp. NPDC017936 TaxID=3365016 RepID=UPI0037BCF1DD
MHPQGGADPLGPESGSGRARVRRVQDVAQEAAQVGGDALVTIGPGDIGSLGEAWLSDET